LGGRRLLEKNPAAWPKVNLEINHKVKCWRAGQWERFRAFLADFPEMSHFLRGNRPQIVVLSA
jgi:hypothetical protein